MKKILALILLVFLFQETTTRINAQDTDITGTYECATGSVGECYVLENSCLMGYHAECTPDVCLGSPFTRIPCIKTTTTNCGHLDDLCSNTAPCCTPTLTCDSKTNMCVLADASAVTNICQFATGSKNLECTNCMKSAKDGGQGGSWTAIGCIPTDPQGFIAKFLGFGVGLAGGIAFLIILFGGLQILTSAGNPEKLNAGRELVGSAVGGLLLIIFSLFILRLIGYNILGIPGFG